MSDSPLEPKIFEYTDYRVYLQDYHGFQKQKMPAYSFRGFAQKAGLSSPNYYKLVMDGKRNLSRKSITKFQAGLGLSGKKAEYFENLVFFNQSETLTDRNFFFARLLKARTRAGLRHLDEHQFQMFAHWHHTAIREMVLLGDFRKQPAWISKRLRRKISPKQAEESLELLGSLGLIKKTANGYAQVDTHISTRDEVRSFFVKNFHDQMMRQARESLDEIAGPERDISSVTLAIRRRDFARLKERLQLMRKELLNLAAESGEAEEVVQINMQLFPLTGRE